MTKQTSKGERARWRQYGPGGSIRDQWTPDKALAKARDAYWKIFTEAFAVELVMEFPRPSGGKAVEPSAPSGLSIRVSLADWMRASAERGGRSRAGGWERAFKACVDDMCRGAATGSAKEKLIAANRRGVKSNSGARGCLRALVEESWISKAFCSGEGERVELERARLCRPVDSEQSQDPLMWLSLSSKAPGGRLAKGSALPLTRETAFQRAEELFQGRALLSWVDPSKDAEVCPSRAAWNAHLESVEILAQSVPGTSVPARKKPRI